MCAGVSPPALKDFLFQAKYQIRYRVEDSVDWKVPALPPGRLLLLPSPAALPASDPALATPGGGRCEQPDLLPPGRPEASFRLLRASALQLASTAPRRAGIWSEWSHPLLPPPPRSGDTPSRAAWAWDQLQNSQSLCFYYFLSGGESRSQTLGLWGVGGQL